MTLAEHVGRRIRERRDAIDMRREELAFKSKVSLKTVENAEQGRVLPRLDTLAAFAVVLGASMEYFVSRGDESAASRLPAEMAA